MRWLIFGYLVVFAAASGCKVYDGSLLNPADSRAVQDGAEMKEDAGDVLRPGDILAPATHDASPSARAEGGEPAPAPDGSDAERSKREAGVPDAGTPLSAPEPPQDDDDAGAASNDAGIDAGPPLCVAAEVGDYCGNLPPLPEPPRIDGQLDCGLRLQQVAPLGWNGSGDVPARPVTFVAAAWREDGLYVYIAVRGARPSPHPAGTRIDCGDAVEMYVDADGDLGGKYDAPGTAQFIVAAPAANSPGTIESIRYINGTANGIFAAQSVATAELDDGYAVEAFITAADLGLTAWTLQPDRLIGFDIAVDVSGMPVRTASGCTASGNQRGQYFLRVSTLANTSCKSASSGEPFCDDRAFCVTRSMP